MNETMIPAFKRYYNESFIPVAFFQNFAIVSSGMLYVTAENLTKVLGVDLIYDYDSGGDNQNVLFNDMGLVEKIKNTDMILYNEYEIISLAEKANTNTASWFRSVFVLHRSAGNFWKVSVSENELPAFYAAAGVELEEEKVRR